MYLSVMLNLDTRICTFSMLSGDLEYKHRGYHII